MDGGETSIANVMVQNCSVVESVYSGDSADTARMCGFTTAMEVWTLSDPRVAETGNGLLSYLRGYNREGV